MIIVIGGTPGSGKTTAVDLLSSKHGLVLVSSGLLFRVEATRRGMTLAEFGAYAKKHHEIDTELDKMVTKMVMDRGGKENLVVDSRLQAYILRKEGVGFFAAHIDAPLEIRAERIAGREAKPVEQALMEIQERERSEKTRYLTIYNIDITELSVYDVAIDSRDKSPDQICEIIWSQVPK